MRRDVQEIFRATPHEKQVMMFSATLSKDIRPVCKKFMQDVRKISVIHRPRSLTASHTHFTRRHALRKLTGHNVSIPPIAAA